MAEGKKSNENGNTHLGLEANCGRWGGENPGQDVRWKFGMPPVNNVNYAWIQHFIHPLPPVGVAGFVISNGSMSTQTGSECDIRKALIEGPSSPQFVDPNR